LDFNGRLVVAGIRERTNEIQWSAPWQFNNIWPKLYSATVRDAENSEITGMATLFDKLIVWTPTSIWSAAQPDQTGLFYLQPVVQGMGFVAHDAVVKIPLGRLPVLIGVAPQGIMYYSGYEPVKVLDVWRRVIPNGVNDHFLSRACAGAWYAENLVFFAVPSSGSEVNDTLLVYDWVDNKWWRWSAPFGGITAISSAFDASGKERVLFGHVNGMITTLVEGVFDGAFAPTGSARSKPVALDAQTALVNNLMVTMAAMGPSPSVTVNLRMNRSGRIVNAQGGSLIFAGPAGDGVYGTSHYLTDAVQAAYSGNPFRSMMLAIPKGLGVGEMVDYEISSSAKFKFAGAELLYTQKGFRQYG